MSRIELGVYGVRGSAPISGRNYMGYGGNTASFTLRTLSNSLIFLDAGTGIRIAEDELKRQAHRVYLVVSHSHADHIQGLGMTGLPYLSELEGYENLLLSIIGPPCILKGFQRFYDGDHIWPVAFTSDTAVSPRMTGIAYESIREYDHDFEDIFLDDTTKVTLLRGNHPVAGGVVLYRFELFGENEPVVIVYATDNEFDFIRIGKPNPKAEYFKRQYMTFISDADLLIADAQYTKDDYQNQYRGFGHSYHQQVIDFADQSKVKQLLLTHHHLYGDTVLDRLGERLHRYVKGNNYSVKVDLAREGQRFLF